MPVKWSALMVNEAMDMVEEYVDQVVEPLEQARIVASEARNIPNLPQYVDQHLAAASGNLSDGLRRGYSLSVSPYPMGRLTKSERELKVAAS